MRPSRRKRLDGVAALKVRRSFEAKATAFVFSSMGTMAPTASFEGEHPIEHEIASSAATAAAIPRSELLDSFMVSSPCASPWVRSTDRRMP